MNKSIALLIATIFVFVSTPAQADAPQKKKKASTDYVPKTQLEMNEDAGQRYKIADDELNQLYKEKIAAIETPINKERFRDAQRAWISFRDKACLYEAGTREEGGSMWALDFNTCMEIHTRRRVEEIKDYIKCQCQN